MASFVANHQKKRKALARREAELQRAIQMSQSERRIRRLATEVRSARLGVLRMQLYVIPSRGENDAEIDTAKQAIARCEEIGIDTIVAEFQSRQRNKPIQE